MKTEDFRELNAGDIVTFIGQGSNHGKKGVVVTIDKKRIVGDPRWKGSVDIIPIDCIFIFRKSMYIRELPNGHIRLYKNEIKLVEKKS